jgi:TIR domain
MVIQHTTEFAATSPEVMRTIVEELRRSPRKYSVFEAIYSGGNKAKDATILAAKTGLSEIAVLQIATPMAHKQFLEQVKENGRVAFKKYPHINAVKQSILRAARRPIQHPKKRPAGIPDSRPVKHSQMVQRRSAWSSKARRRRTRGSRYDVFVSHASEDKAYVRRLTAALKEARIKVWYDEDVIGWGDDLRRSIDRGLANSHYGIVVFSKAFLKKKHWTEHELDGLFAKERQRRKVILPIWHNITDRELLRYSPAFADRIAMISKKDSIKDIVEALKKLMKS